MILKQNEFEKLDKNNRKLISEKEKLEQEKKFYLNQKINLILKNQKKFLKKYQKYQKSKLLSQKKLNELLHILPNLALDDVPIGKDEKSNKLIKKFGKIKKFKFKPKSHTEIGLKNNEIDFDTSIKIIWIKICNFKK